MKNTIKNIAIWMRWKWCTLFAALRVRATKRQYPNCDGVMAAEVVTTGTGNANVAIQGTTTLRWGTNGLFGAYVVTRISAAVKGENLYVTNGDGIETGRQQLQHGQTQDITVRDSTLIQPPQWGTKVVLYDFGLLYPGNVTNPALQIAFRIIDASYDTAPKQPGERVIRCEKLNTFVEV